MDGIFGIGLAEMAVIALVLFIIGGPENTAKWAREAGRWVRKLREAWAQMMADVEREMGPDGQELLNATRELSRGAHELRTATSPRRLVANPLRSLERLAEESSPDESSPPTPAPPNNGAEPTGQPTYRAWLPPEED